MADRDFWLTIRRALLMIVSAIERRYGCGSAPPEVADALHG